ncbi:hypothetical protein AYI68_g2688 [Smittium mucronatum]|uniref:PSP1 C-terminal domain-containing protein n=1 Tax=Smittium mucronatum TaxID=133383 RepID=A0A1R0H215_9FUNG|nr:hypothetical protein AYI68_g2688 [Smittium mucronatum]
MLSFTNTLEENIDEISGNQSDIKNSKISQLKASLVSNRKLEEPPNTDQYSMKSTFKRESDIFPEADSIYKSSGDEVNIDWKAVGSQSTRVLAGSLSKEDQGSIWGLDSLVEDTEKLSFDKGAGLSKLGGMMVGNSSNQSNNLGQNPANDSGIYSSEAWPPFPRKIGSDSYDSGEKSNLFNFPSSGMEIKNSNRFGAMGNHTLVNPKRESDSSLKDLDILNMAAADAAAEAEFVDSVLMSAMDISDKTSTINSSASLGSKAPGTLYPLSHSSDQTGARPNVVPRHSSFDLSDLHHKSSLGQFIPSNAPSNPLFNKNNSSSGFPELSFPGQPLPVLGQQSETQNAHIGQVNNNPYQMRYRNPIQSMQYYDNFYPRGSGPGPNFSSNVSGLSNIYPISGKTSFPGLNDTPQGGFIWPQNGGYIPGSLKNEPPFSFSYNRPPSLQQPNYGSLNFQQSSIGLNIPPSNLNQSNISHYSSSSGMKMQIPVNHQNNPNNLGAFQSPSQFYGNNSGSNNSSLSDMGRGVPLNLLPSDARIFVVQFKGKRNDLFFFSKSSSENKVPSNQNIAPGVCAIVEADRGQDLGLIIEEYSSKDQAIQFMASRYREDDSKDSNNSSISDSNKNSSSGSSGNSEGHSNTASVPQFSDVVKSNLSLGSDVATNNNPKEKTSPQNSGNNEPFSQINPKDISIKRVFRVADSTDIDVMVSKSQDEQKALLVCQAKVRSLKLPMEVVDAEYQWDRRKLIFFFNADHRIDFRELVRELFKTYKTRIWMCAVDQR